MLDHGQLGPDTPATSRPASLNDPSPSRRSSRPDSIPPSSDQQTPSMASRTGSGTDHRSRRPSGLGLSDVRGVLGRGDSLSMSALETEDPSEASSGESEMAENQEKERGKELSRSRATRRNSSGISNRKATEHSNSRPRPPQISLEAATSLGHQLSDAISASPNLPQDRVPPPLVETMSTADVNSQPHSAPPREVTSPSDLAAHLFANPNLVSLKWGTSPPILNNSQCSGYFLEPVGTNLLCTGKSCANGILFFLWLQMIWMESFLAEGKLAGKIICPNGKCGAKLGNYDWAGVCCGCKEWVTPVSNSIRFCLRLD
jgi:dual specificity phosphatase 12